MIAARDIEPAACAECGHLHYLGPEHGYCECPIDGCDCAGQTWAHHLHEGDIVTTSTTPKTTAAQLDLALDRMRGDWDADGTTSIHLPRDVAERLLAERGWQPVSFGGWVLERGGRIHQLDEALQLALVAENS